MDEYYKITTGFVTQHFKRDKDGNFHFIEQNFTAGGECEYEFPLETPIDIPEDEVYHPFEMK
jgi:hypothetical protein